MIRFVETFCVFTNGRWTGQPMKLLPWQIRLIWELFEVIYDPSIALDDGKFGAWRRKYRRALIGLPRKAGKTELAAAIMLYLLVADGERSAELYCAATTEEQADRVFEAARRMVHLGPLKELLDYPPDNHRQEMPKIAVRSDPFSYFQRLTAKGGSKHGLNVHAVVFDELHAWKEGEGEELYAAMSTGSAARLQPLQLAITTAGTRLDTSRCGALFKLGMQIERGEVEDDGSLFFRWWSAPEDCDWTDPAMWAAACPSYGYTVTEGFYRQEMLLGERMFRRLYLNQWVPDEGESWLPPGAWDLGDIGPFEFMPRATVYIGWDASSKHDSTALWVTQPWRCSGGYLHLRNKAYVWERPRDAQGRFVEGWKVPTSEVEAMIRALCSRLDVRTVAYDEALIGWSADDLEDEGLPMETWPQHDSRMVPATADAYELIVSPDCMCGERRFQHDGDPVVARHLRDVAVKVARSSGGERLIKPARQVLVDAAIAMVMAVGAYKRLEGTETGPPSVFVL